MRIGIDGRLINETGVGRYIRNLVRELGDLDKTNEFVLFLRKKDFQHITVPNTRWTKREADIPWHTVTEQICMPWILMREHLDLVHVPYFTAPLWYPGKFILTIHDLTIHHTHTGRASTLPSPLYALRRIGYDVVLRLGAARAAHILTVSQEVKKDLVQSLHIPEEKITVTYEGVEAHMLGVASAKPIYPDKYFLYVGNAYPHKNLDRLIEGYALYAKQVAQPIHLVLVGKRDYFYNRLREYVDKLGLPNIYFFGTADDEQLQNLYAHAQVFVFPSRMEGFGLPAVEAIASLCPLICSNISIFHEIVGDAATYVDTRKPVEIASALATHAKELPNMRTRVARQKQILATYSWKTMAKQTLMVYEQMGTSS